MQSSVTTVVPLKQHVDEDAFRQVADALPQIVWVATAAGAAQYFNQLWYDYTGLSEVDSMGPDRWRLVYHSEDTTHLRDSWNHSLATGKHFDVEFRIRGKDDVFRWFLCRGKPIRDERGQILRWCGTLTDIDDKKKVQEQLREESEFSRSVVDSSLDCIKVVDAKGRLLSMNAGGQQMMQIPDFSVCKMREWTSFWQGEHQRNANRALAAVLAGNPQSFEGQCNTFAGELRWWNVQLTPLPEADGRIERVLIVSRDITEQRRRENEFRQLADAMPQKVWVTRPDGYHEYYNKRWYDFTGLDYDTTKGEGWNNVFHPDDQQEAWNRWNHSLHTGEPYEIEYRLRRHDGEYRWMLGRALPIYNDEGKIERWFGTCTDIHDRILSGLELQHSMAEAEAASIAKTEFLAHVSHEIRTPMNAVVGIANILAGSEPLTDLQREYISTLHVSAEQLLQLINDLLDMSRLESRAVQLETVAFDINALLRDVLSIARVSAREKHIELELRGKSQHQVVGDPLRIKQIILNLVGNAVKFTDEGAVTVTLFAGARDDKVDLLIAVEDTGIGIPPDKLAGIFDKFAQAESSTARRFGGSGLGLAIAKTLVELMGGTISVTSTPGKGSCFTVSLALPAASRPAPRMNAPQADMPVRDTPPSTTVLLVEDYQANVMVATMLLESFGYRYGLASSGEEALAKLAKEPYDVVLMDVQMPRMNGFEATAAIRAREAATGAPRLPIIGMTAHALKGDRERCLAAGMDDYISKPFRPETLKELLERYSPEAVRA